ncbi:MAG TPA: cysteine desulfurase family protein [Candidatus Nanopelagicaceae bacterium]|nr:cysteine desulfurase family protein [Candidatus Nanopelagicaceae bacterium]
MGAYLDHAATTPMSPGAIEAMVEELGRSGNASSLHAAGRRARKVVEDAREVLAQAAGARPNDVIFTSGGTEADNLAVKGIFWARRKADPRRVRILASSVEHHAVLDPVEWLASNDGAEVSWIPVDAKGRIEIAALRQEILRDPDSISLITVMAANNEVGTVQPIAEVVALADEFGIPVHSDAVQLFGKMPFDFDASGLAAATISAHKIGGPIGVGALLVKRGLDIIPVLHGGGQERDIRSGTLDTPAIASFAAAARDSIKQMADEDLRLRSLRDDLVAKITELIPDARMNGDDDPLGRLPGNAHFTFPGAEGNALLLLLDAQGVQCSTGSACSAGVPRPSHVLVAMGMSESQARSSLRFSLGRTSSQADVDAVAQAIVPVIERARLAAR